MEENDVLGYSAVFVAVLFFGIYAVPVKLYDTGDGIAFQFFECIGIFLVGFFVQVFVVGLPSILQSDSLHFYPEAALGGVAWWLGNAFVVPVVNSIGLGLGLLVWGSANMLVGWASGRFGFFGLLKPEIPTPIGYVGVAVALVSLLLYLPIKTSTTNKSNTNGNDGTADSRPTYGGDRDARDSRGSSNRNIQKGPHSSLERLLTADYNDDDLLYSLSSGSLTSGIGSGGSGAPGGGGGGVAPGSTQSTTASFGTFCQKIVGFLMALLSGVFYGVNTIPIEIIVQREKQAGHPLSSPLIPAFSHFTGILIMSFILMVGYSVGKCNKPFINPRTVFPGFVAGILWAVAECAWFVANDSLSIVKAFPIICIGPGAVGSLLGILVFKEIRGLKNFIFFGLAFLGTVVAIVLIALSKIPKTDG